MNKFPAALTAVGLVLALAGCSAFTPAAPSVHATQPSQTVTVMVSSPAPYASAPPLSVTAPVGKYLGVATPGGDWDATSAWRQATGTTPGIVEEYLGWEQPFPNDVLNSYPSGVVGLLAWDPTSTTLEQIAAGQDDAYLETFAEQAAAWGRPVAVSFGHEFNGNWDSWGQDPKGFVTAWRHIHDVFTLAGANNIIWVWTPNVVNPVPDIDLRMYWPGERYVTWVGLVGYWTGQLGEDSWAGLFGRTEHIIAGFTSKKVLVVETGVQQGSRKAAWTRDLLVGAQQDPHLLGLIYFDYGLAQGKRADWTLEDDPGALSVWRQVTAGWPKGRVAL